MAQSRLKWVDNIKGIAMISVVLCHVADGFYGANVYSNINSILFVIRNICNIFQMPLFCMASGYLFSKAYLDLDKGEIKKDRLIRQIKNLLSIYVLWCLIMGIFKILLSGKVNYEVKPVDLLLIWFKPIGVYWYLYVLIALYILFSFRFKLKVNDFVLVIILTVISIGASFLVNYEGYLFAFRRIAYFGIIFFIGMMLGKDEYKGKIRFISSILFSIAIVLCVVFWNNENELYHIPVVNLFTAIGICLGIIMVFQIISEKIRFRLLSLIGKNSLDVYLLHVFLAAGCRMVMGRIPEIPEWISIVSTFIISLFLPIVIGFIAKKLHVYDLLFKPYSFIENHKK